MTRSGASELARSMNNCSASASGSEGTGTSRSPVTISGSRLVARIVTVGHARTIVSIASPAAVSTCSQLSTTISSRLRFSAETMPLITAPSLAALRPRPAAKANSTAPASATVANSTNQQPSGKIGAAAAAASMDSLVLPAPPAPISVTTRCPANSPSRPAISSWRPTNSLTSVGIFPARSGGVRSAGYSPRPSWNSRTEGAMPFRRYSPRSSISRSATNSALAADSRTWPPWPASITRAARFRVGPK